MFVLDQPTPKQPGFYIWKAKFSGRLDLIEVYYIEPRFEYGCKWDGYLAYGGSGNSVTKLQGTFSKRLELKDDVLAEV